MKAETLDQLGRLADECDAVLFGYQNMKQLPDRIHLQALAAKLFEVRDRLGEIYDQNGGPATLVFMANEHREEK